MSGIEFLTDILCHPYADAQLAMARAGGDVNRAADILLEGSLRRSLTKFLNSSTTNVRAGPSRMPPTPPSTASPATIVIESSDDDDDDDAEGDDDDEYSPSTPCPATSATANSTAGSRPYLDNSEISNSHGSDGHVSAAHNHANSTDATFDDYAQCVCTLGNNDHMIQCTACQRWYHYECVHLHPDMIPTGDWFCHFEHNSSTKPLDNSGNRMNDVESRALFLTVKHLAPLSRRFWENVSEYLLSQFNVKRSVTSVKMEWLRYSSAWFGFDERNCTQYEEKDVAARKALFRSSQKDQKQPPLLWKWLEMPITKPGEETENAPKQRKPRVLNKSPKRVNKKSVSKLKRKFVVIEESDSEDEVVVVHETKRIRRATAAAPIPRPTVGGKFVAGVEVFHEPAATFANELVVQTDYIESPATPPMAAATIAADITTSTTGFMIPTAIQSTTSTALSVPVTAYVNGVDNVTSFPDVSTSVVAAPAPTHSSRFDDLAAHRRHVKEYLKDIEPNLDWAESFGGQTEDLWNGFTEPAWEKLFGEDAQLD